MNPQLPDFPSYSQILSEDAYVSKLELSEDARKIADEIERQITLDPESFRHRAKPIGQKGQVLVYTHPDSTLEVTFEIDEEKERVLFYRYTDRQLKLLKTIFISYSHTDNYWLKELRAVFDILEQLGEISFWDDENIESGDDWRATLEEKLDTANAAVLLVSDAFLESKFIKSFELPKILDKKDKDVYWIHLSKSKVAEKEPRITEYQSLSSNPEITLNDLVKLGPGDLSTELFRIAKALSKALSTH